MNDAAMNRAFHAAVFPPANATEYRKLKRQMRQLERAAHLSNSDSNSDGQLRAEAVRMLRQLSTELNGCRSRVRTLEKAAEADRRGLAAMVSKAAVRAAVNTASRPDLILNPKTGRWVKPDGKVGSALRGVPYVPAARRAARK